MRLENNQKDDLKTKMLGALNNSDPDVRRSACQCVSAVASIEIPEGQWPNLISTLSDAMSDQALNIKLASVQTIGYICEELESKDLSSQDRELVLSILITGIEQTDQSLVKIGVQALYHAIEYTEEIFAKGQGNIVMDSIKKACESQDDDI